jgi:phosphatidylinositol alpha-1,6-mannosyltransferase
MKILLVAPSFPPVTGGIENLMENIAVNSEHEIDVLTKTAENAEDSKYDFKVTRKDFDGYTGFLKKSVYLLKQTRDYDAIYLAAPDTSWVALPSSLTETKIVSHAHGRELFIEIHRLRTYLRKFLFLLGIRGIDQFIAVSDWTASRLEELGIPEPQIKVVPNGVDVKRFSENQDKAELDVEDDDFVLLTVSRLDPRKGHDLVLETIQNIDCRYVIVGSGDREELLREQAESLGVSDKVIFAGYVEDDKLPAYYNSADVFVMPSKHLEDGNVEGFGIVYLEANAAGLPVIGSRTGGIPTAINDGYNGLLCDPESDSVKDSILKLKENNDLREKISKNAVEWAEKHDWENIIEKIDRVLAK